MPIWIIFFLVYAWMFWICGQILTKYAIEHAITKQDVDRFIEKYPMEIYKAIYDTGVQLFNPEWNG